MTIGGSYEWLRRAPRTRAAGPFFLDDPWPRPPRSDTVGIVLFGRDWECGEIDRLLEGATGGAGAARALRGPPGVGKTALLRWVADNVRSASVVSVRCAEQDCIRADATLGAILSRLAPSPGDAWAEQATALHAMLGTCPPAMRDATGIGAALVSLLSVASREQPLVVLIDDAHWIDVSSREALLFAARRIEHEAVVVLVAVWEADDESFARDLPVLDIQGLSPLDAAALLGDRVELGVAEALADRTDGNPLAMLEIAEQLSPEERSGAVPLGLVGSLSDGLLQGFLSRTTTLTDSQRAVLLFAAADPCVDLDRLRAAATIAGFTDEAVTGVLSPGLLTVRGELSLEIVHPLLRVAIYQSATDKDRRRAHAVLAQVLEGTDHVERRAWHLAAAAPQVDEDAALALDAAARVASARGDGVVAGEAFTRAAELSTDPERRRGRLVAAGVAFAAAAANERALDAYDEALAITSTPGARAEVHLLRVEPYIQARGPAGFHTELLQLTSELEPTDPELATMISAIAAVPALAAGEMRAARFLSRRALHRSRADREEATRPGVDADGQSRTGPGETAAERVAALLHALASSFSGDIGVSLPPLLEYSAPGSRGPVDPHTAPYAAVVADVLTFAGQFSASSRLLSHVIAAARERSSVGELALALAVRAELYFRTAYWPAARADAEEAAGLARDARHVPLLGYALHALTRVEAGLGRRDGAARHGAEALDVATRYGLGSVVFGVRATLGFLALSEARPSAAVTHLEHARDIAEREEIGLVMANPWAPDLVEAYLRAGRAPDARALAGRLAADGVAEQGLLSAAVLGRCRGLVAKSFYDDLFEAALAAHTRARSPFELARTELCFGERLRRDRRLVDAVPHLGAAAAAFRQIGAEAWCLRATRELEAEDRDTVESSSTGDATPLTSQELRIAVTVADGATNREAAAALFLSPRTVEYHLAKIYRKLGVRSRTELARYIASGVDATPVPGDLDVMA